MSVKIEKVTESHFLVNGKSVFKDMNGKWVTSIDLTDSEKKIFLQHIRSLEEV